VSELAALEAAVTECRRCPRLVTWREQVARDKRAAFAHEEYWGRPIPGFGDPDARVLILGLAPAAHGANRTGRIFTGDRSGDFLFEALWRTGFANQAVSHRIGDGLELRDCFVTSPVRCAPPANKPLPAERDACASWLVAEAALLRQVRVVVALGGFAWAAALRLRAALGHPVPRPAPRFRHGGTAGGPIPLMGEPADSRESAGGPIPLMGGPIPFSVLGCFHPSQQNTFTGRLTPAMAVDVLEIARDLAGLPAAVRRPQESVADS
jgi:uracil-DNA glycosylase family 4